MNKRELETIIRKSRQQKRGAKTEIYVDIDGEVRSLKAWSEFFGLEYATLLYRYNQGKRGRDLIKPPYKKLNNFI